MIVDSEGFLVIHVEAFKKDLYHNRLMVFQLGGGGDGRGGCFKRTPLVANSITCTHFSRIRVKTSLKVHIRVLYSIFFENRFVQVAH